MIAAGFLGGASLRLLATLALTQLIGWGACFASVGVLARPIGVGLGVSTSAVFAATTGFLVAMALGSPYVAGLLRRQGARAALVWGSALAGVVQLLMAAAPDYWSLAALWAALGLAGALMLATAANAALTEQGGGGARRAIAALMLATGLAATAFLPIATFLEAQLGWRGCFVIFALAHLFICLPLHILCVPRRPAAATLDPAPLSAKPPARKDGPSDQRLFWLMSLAASLTGFVTWGMSVIMVELLRAAGLAEAAAVALASMVGIAQLAARGADFLFGQRSSVLTNGLIALGFVPLGFLTLLVGGADAAWAFVAIYGAGAGVLAVVRATLPLELFDPAAYGPHAARLALPMVLSFAAGPPVFGYALERFGLETVAMIAIAACVGALGAMTALKGATRRAARSRCMG